jgi:hypothetical protein
VRSVSIGKLKTYQMYEGFKVRAHLPKVNTELLRKSVPKFWARLERAMRILEEIWLRPSWFRIWK